MKTKNTERETNNRCSVSGDSEEREAEGEERRRRRMDIIASLSAALFVHSSDSRPATARIDDQVGNCSKGIIIFLSPLREEEERAGKRGF